VRYPALAEFDEYQCRDTHEIVRIDPDTDQIVSEHTSLTEVRRSRLKPLRKRGEALHPERYTTKQLRSIKATLLPRHWSALYQQNPVPDEGVFFRKDQLIHRRAPDRNVYKYQAWDFSITEKTTSDWIVGAMVVQDEENDAYLHPAMLRFRSADGENIVETMLDFYQQHRPNVIGVEDGQIWRSLEATFIRRARERGLTPNYEVLRPLTDKLVRARPLQGLMQMKRFFIDQTMPLYDDVVRELLRFPGGKHDDIIDAISWAVRLVLSRPAPRKPTVKKLKSWKDQLNSLTGSAMGSHMSA